ncbi:MAG: LysM peptidoglycan-binding domain-containing protein [Flammeovirgaceae bacterium]
MALQEKYQAVLDLGLEFGVKDGDVQETEGKLKVSGTAHSQFQKDRIWDKIKEIGGEEPTDIEAHIEVEQQDYYHKHVVAKGETLGKIAKAYFGDAMKYKEIYEANKDILKSPDLIFPDQELTIPFIS